MMTYAVKGFRISRQDTLIDALSQLSRQKVFWKRKLAFAAETNYDHSTILRYYCIGFLRCKLKIYWSFSSYGKKGVEILPCRLMNRIVCVCLLF